MTHRSRAAPLRILAVLQGPARTGGGNHQSVNALIQLALIAERRFEVSVLDIGGIHRDAIDRAIEDRLLPDLPRTEGPLKPVGIKGRFKRSTSNLARAIRAVLGVSDRKGDLAQFIDDQPVDVVYFLYPSGLAGRIQKKNIITTVWDLCHRDFPEFPEVRSQGEFEAREAMLRSHVNRSIAVVVDANQSADRLVRDYGVDRERIVVMPFSPASAVTSGSARTTDEVLARLNLVSGYLFYPAQFWPHKNHIRLVEALALRKADGRDDTAVFAGGDKGGLSRVLAVAEDLGVLDRITVLGYVEDLDLRALYLGAKALVMPTYFGPTNLPPLEAWATGRPVVYPEHLAEQVGDAALLFDVDDAESLAQRLAELDVPSVAERLSQRGQIALQRWFAVQQERSLEFTRALVRLESRTANFR
jgi:glycosyltransferase involved in cell wall biosynthesis